MTIMFLFFFVVQVVMASPCLTNKCSKWIGLPTSRSTFDMLKHTLDVNCFQMYHVTIPKEKIDLLEDVYNKAILAKIEYDDAYTSNANTLYYAKTWLSTVASDPLSLGQRQAKECNAQLIVNDFGNEDVATLFPVFIDTLRYINTCLINVRTDIIARNRQLKFDYTNHVTRVSASTVIVHRAYEKVLQTTADLISMRTQFDNWMNHKL